MDDTAVKIGGVPFQEAIDFFRGKLNLPTRAWDDLRGEVHAKAFTVAGATKADLLADLRGAVDAAIANGESMGSFRKRFDAVVQQHGWTYKGKRGWRTRVIYDTNLRTAHMAGKWKQIQRTKDRRPYLQYLDAGDGRVRPLHRQWDETVLRVDDAWWNTHYPPNGWGCRCTVRTLSQRQLEREGLSVGQAPLVNRSERVNTRTGEVYGDVPEGIDTGWDYNVGKAWLGPEFSFGEQLAALPKSLRDPALAALPGSVGPQLQAHFRNWAREVLDAPNPRGGEVTVGYLDHVIFNDLEARGMPPETVAITVQNARLRQMERGLEQRLGRNLSDIDLMNLAQSLADPRAVLLDVRNPALVYVFDAGLEDRLGKFAVRVNFRQRGQVSNSVQSGDVTPLRHLRDRNQFALIKGEL